MGTPGATCFPQNARAVREITLGSLAIRRDRAWQAHRGARAAPREPYGIEENQLELDASLELAASFCFRSNSSICFRKLSGRISVQTSLTYCPHSARVPSLQTFQPLGTAMCFGQSEYCSSQFMSTR